MQSAPPVSKWHASSAGSLAALDGPEQGRAAKQRAEFSRKSLQGWEEPQRQVLTLWAYLSKDPFTLSHWCHTLIQNIVKII